MVRRACGLLALAVLAVAALAAFPRTAEAVCIVNAATSTEVNFRATAITASSITFEWNRPSCASGNVSWRITAATLTGGGNCCSHVFADGGTTSSSSSSTLSWTKTGLNANTTYHWRVRIDQPQVERTLFFPHEARLSVTTRQSSPGAPGGVTVTPGVGRLAVSWTAATNADGYKVQWKSGMQAYAAARQATVGSGTTHTITGLTAGTEYTVRVIATRTNAADGPASTEETGTPQRPPTATLVLNPSAIPENGGISTVTARLSRPATEATTLTVATTAVSPAVAGDFTRTGNTLTIAAGSTTSAGLVTVTANGNAVDSPNKSVTVSGTAAGGDGVSNPSDVTLTIADDDEKGLALAPEVLIAEGGSGSYTAVLTSEPTGAVTVSVSTEDDADLTVSPSRLTFAPTDWSEAQTVTVTGAGVAASELRHAASGGGYDGVAKNLWVAAEDLWVPGEGASEIETTGARGTETMRTIVMNGHPVTVTKAKGVPPSVRIVPLDAPDGPLKVTFTPLTDEQAAAAAGSGYGLGPAASRVAVNVPSALGGGRLCLPVTDVRGAARGRPLLLLHYDGSAWEAVAGSAANADGTMVCADREMSFPPFAVGYEDTAPSFVAASRTYTFTVDEAQSETLPKAEEGFDVEVTYRLEPDPPPGLMVDEAAGTLSGTPTESMKARDYSWTARDVDGDESDPIVITIEVVSDLGAARERLAALNESILPELARATWGSVVDAVTGRLESSGAGSGMAATLASALKAREGAQEGEGLSWRDVVEGRTFAVALGGGAGAGAGSGGGGVGGDGSGAAGAVMWGGGSRRSLSLDKESLDWSGDLFSAHVGVDAPLGEGLRGGLALSWFEGEIDYTDRSGDAAVAGAHESRLTAVHPYAGWSGADGSRLWGALGYGEGEIEIADAEFVERFGVQKGGSAFVGVAAGGSVPVASADGLTLALKGSGEATRYSVEDNGLAIAGVSVKTQRLRLAAEGSRTWALADGGTLTPALEVGARWDGGDGETGAGVELGGGLEWVSDGLSVEARGRMLAAHEGDVEEWGVSGSARLLPGSGGRGLSFTLSPRWGASESGLARLWDEGLTGGASSGADADADAARLEAELGYGFGVWEGSGLATPHAGVGYGNDGAHHWRLGTRFAFGPDVAVGLEAERREGAADPEHGAGLELRLRW